MLSLIALVTAVAISPVVVGVVENAELLALVTHKTAQQSYFVVLVLSEVEIVLQPELYLVAIVIQCLLPDADHLSRLHERVLLGPRLVSLLGQLPPLPYNVLNLADAPAFGLLLAALAAGLGFGLGAWQLRGEPLILQPDDGLAAVLVGQVDAGFGRVVTQVVVHLHVHVFVENLTGHQMHSQVTWLIPQLCALFKRGVMFMVRLAGMYSILARCWVMVLVWWFCRWKVFSSCTTVLAGQGWPGMSIANHSLQYLQPLYSVITRAVCSLFDGPTFVEAYEPVFLGLDEILVADGLGRGHLGKFDQVALQGVDQHGHSCAGQVLIPACLGLQFDLGQQFNVLKQQGLGVGAGHASQIITLKQTQKHSLNQDSQPKISVLLTMLPRSHSSLHLRLPSNLIPSPCFSSFSQLPSHQPLCRNTSRPLPQHLSIFHSPSQRSPLRQQYLPQPSLQSCLNSPQYRYPLAQISTPLPQRLSLVQNPSCILPSLSMNERQLTSAYRNESTSGKSCKDFKGTVCLFWGVLFADFLLFFLILDQLCSLESLLSLFLDLPFIFSGYVQTCLYPPCLFVFLFFPFSILPFPIGFLFLSLCCRWDWASTANVSFSISISEISAILF